MTDLEPIIQNSFVKAMVVVDTSTGVCSRYVAKECTDVVIFEQGWDNKSIELFRRGVLKGA